MRMISCLAILAVGASSTLAGCVADTTDPDPTDGEASAQEDVGEAAEELGTCYGNSCNGLDAGATGCEADATTRASSSIWTGSSVIGQIVIRYSPSCNAAWARTVTTAGAYYLRAEITRSSPFATGQAASPAPVTALRSPMIGATAGSTFTAVGRIGSSYGSYPYAGNVSTNF